MTNSLAIRIEHLPPMRVARFHAVSVAPERDAWEMLRAFAEPLGLLDNPQSHPVFGFNNPNPSAGRKEYGSEFWIRLDSDAEARPGIEYLDFAGGFYAVTSRKLIGEPSLPETWRAMWEAVRAGPYKWRNTHELEKVQDPRAPEDSLVLDLYLPIEPPAGRAALVKEP